MTRMNKVASELKNVALQHELANIPWDSSREVQLMREKQIQQDAVSNLQQVNLLSSTFPEM